MKPWNPLKALKKLPPARPVSWDEKVPTPEEVAELLLPYLFHLRNLGWPGLSERDRDDITNLTWDLDRALDRRTK